MHKKTTENQLHYNAQYIYKLYYAYIHLQYGSMLFLDMFRHALGSCRVLCSSETLPTNIDR